MKKLLKKVVTLGVTVCLGASSCMTAFAGEWKQDDIGQWYVNDDGSYTTKNWQIIDNVAYYFGSTGYMLGNTSSWIELFEDGSYSIDYGNGAIGVAMLLPDLSTGHRWGEMQAMSLDMLIYQWREKTITTKEEVANYISSSALGTLTAEEQNELTDIITLKY